MESPPLCPPGRLRRSNSKSKGADPDLPDLKTASHAIRASNAELVRYKAGRPRKGPQAPGDGMLLQPTYRRRSVLFVGR